MNLARLIFGLNSFNIVSQKFVHGSCPYFLLTKYINSIDDYLHFAIVLLNTVIMYQNDYNLSQFIWNCLSFPLFLSDFMFLLHCHFWLHLTMLKVQKWPLAVAVPKKYCLFSFPTIISCFKLRALFWSCFKNFSHGQMLLKFDLVVIVSEYFLWDVGVI